MNTIHKFTVPCIGAWFEIETHRGARPLSAQIQGGQFVFWLYVPLHAEKVRQRFIAVGTGHAAPDLAHCTHVGTVQDPGTGFVWHLFQF